MRLMLSRSGMVHALSVSSLLRARITRRVSELNAPPPKQAGKCVATFKSCQAHNLFVPLQVPGSGSWFLGSVCLSSSFEGPVLVRGKKGRGGNVGKGNRTSQRSSRVTPNPDESDSSRMGSGANGDGWSVASNDSASGMAEVELMRLQRQVRFHTVCFATPGQVARFHWRYFQKDMGRWT